MASGLVKRFPDSFPMAVRSLVRRFQAVPVYLAPSFCDDADERVFWAAAAGASGWNAQMGEDILS